MHSHWIRLTLRKLPSTSTNGKHKPISKESHTFPTRHWPLEGLCSVWFKPTLAMNLLKFQLNPWVGGHHPWPRGKKPSAAMKGMSHHIHKHTHANKPNRHFSKFQDVWETKFWDMIIICPLTGILSNSNYKLIYPYDPYDPYGLMDPYGNAPKTFVRNHFPWGLSRGITHLW